MNYKTLIFICSVLFGNAQTRNNAVIKLQYLESVNQDSPITNNYIGTLFSQNDLSYYKSEYKNSESDTNKNQEDIIELKSESIKFTPEVFNNIKSQELVENIYESKFLKKSFSVIDNNLKLKWIISKEERIFNTIRCKKATTIFRGRTYTAWFTEKYPISAGPWKFSGLPGLILYIEDNKGFYKWKLINITYPYKGQDINMDVLFAKRYRYQQINYKDFDKKYIEAIKDKIDIIHSRSTNSSNMKGSFSYSTEFEKEPTNEWRSQSFFR